jgi:predicted phosphodiesterase
MRIALLADVHGNPIALDAVLEDIERLGGVDEVWVLGDLVALGPAPVEVLERLSALQHACTVRAVRGNTERYVCTGDRPPPSLDEATADPALLPVLVDVAGTFAWTQGAVSQAGWLEWLSRLPLEQRTALPDGTRMLGVHASPGRDDGPGFHADQSRADQTQPESERLLAGCDADLVCVGHTHAPLDVVVGGTRVVNPGSASNPVTRNPYVRGPAPPDLRASYALLHASAGGYTVEHRRVDYDREAVVAALRRLRHPGAAFIIHCLRGSGE